MDRHRVAAHAFSDGLPETEVDAVARVASEREFAADQTLMTEGDFGHCLFLIESGTAEVSVGGEKVADLGPGDVVGETAVLVSGRRSASVRATSAIRAIGLFKRDVWKLEHDAPEAARRLRAAFEQRAGSRPDSAPAG